jgi:Zn-dependent metalloprotease
MRKLSFDILSKLLTAIPLLLVVAPVAHAADPLSSMEEQGAAIDRDKQSGRVTFIGKGREQPVNGLNNVLGYSTTTNDEKNASALLQTFGHSFGLSNPKAQMQVMRKDMGLIHYQQMHGGIPVIGGELVVSMVKHKFNSMNGEVSQNLPQSTAPGISADVAIATAKLLVQQQYGLYDPQKPLETTTPELQIYDPKLLDTGDKNGPARLVWRIEISPTNGPFDIHEIAFVDAQTGSIALNFN